MKAIVPVVLATLLLAGCVTQKIDWAARVGNYTYDQAVMEFGPPDKTARLSDGTTIAEWLTQRGRVVVAPEPYFAPPGCYFGPLTPMYSETYVPARFLRLVFDAKGILKTWKEFAR
jgi:hypothetical protein